MARTKVLMIVFNEFRPDMRVYNEAIMLKNQKKYDVTILALNKTGKLPEQELVRGNLPLIRVQMPARELYLNFFSPLFKSRIVPLLSRRAAAEGAEIYHCHDIYTLPVGMNLKSATNAKIVYDAHEPNYGTFLAAKPLPLMPARIRESLANAYEKRAANRTDMMLVTTEFALEAKRSRGYTVPIEVVPYRANPAFFGPKMLNKDLRARYKGKRVVIFIGNIGENKGFFEMLEAFKKLMRDVPDAFLLIVGEVVPWLSPLKTIKDMGLGAAVEIVGYTPYWEVAPYINIASAGLMLSHEDMENYRLTLPNKIIDYMACGRPFVASRLPQVERIVSTERCGVIVDSADTDAIATALAELLTDRNKARRMGERGLEAVSGGEYSWGAVEATLAGVYDGLIADQKNC